MHALIARYRDRTQLVDGGEIPALHGLRAFMVLAVAAFHFWQQSWLTPAITLAGGRYSLDTLLRTGYMWVEGMLLLSGFLCFLPHAYAAQAGRAAPPALPFYRRRVQRIYPSYLLNLLLVLLLIALPQRRFAGPWEAARDILAHLSFTHNLFDFSYRYTPLNGVLWTLAVEVQFYLLFPLLARAFRRMPLLTYLLMAGTAFSFRAFAMHQQDSSLLFNQLPAFLDVYANGFVAASIFVSLRRRMKEDSWTRILMTVAAAAAVAAIAMLLKDQARETPAEAIRRGQMMRRYGFSALLALLMLGVSLGLGGIRLALGNRVTRFLSAISFQFYMYHQLIAVELKRLRIPASISDNPHHAGEFSWQWRYILLCFLLSLLVSTLCTYLVERPASRLLGGKKGGKS